MQTNTEGRRLTGPELVSLVERARQGDGRAWETLVRDLAGAVYCGLAPFDLPRATKEDLFQETFVKLLERIDTIDRPEALVSWLITTAGNAARGYLRRHNRVVVVPDLEDEPVGGDAPDEALLDEELHRALYAAFNRLGSDHQELIRLLTIDPPLTYAEIAEILGRSVGHIGPTRQRCLEKLRSTPELAPFFDRHHGGRNDR